MSRLEVIIVAYLLGFMTPAAVHAFGIWPFVYLGCVNIVIGIVFTMWCAVQIDDAHDNCERERDL